MGKLDERLRLSGAAMSYLPLLLLPMVVGSLVLLVRPSLDMGRWAILISTVMIAWYLLGGALAIAHAGKRIAVRRALSAIKGEVAAAPEPIWICDADGQVIFQNPTSRERFGDILGQTMLVMLQRLRADADCEMEDLLARALACGGAELSLDNGDVIALSGAADAPLWIWSFHEPAQEIGAFDLALAAEEQDLDDGAMLAALPVALLEIDGAGRILRANRAACSLMGMQSDSDLVDARLGSLLDGPGRSLSEWIADVSAGRADGRPEVLRQRRSRSIGPASDQQDRYFQLSLAVCPGDRSRLIAVLNDASAMKTLEAQFAQSQKMQAIGQLAGGVAHDFNNLLTAISGHCDLLMLRLDKDHPDYADLDQISQNANRAAALVGQLLAFSRKQTLHMETLDLRDTLADLTHLLNRLVGERVRLTIRHDPSLSPIRADKRQLEQVIMNLVVNARDAMPDGGEVAIDTDLVSLDAPLGRERVTLAPGDYVRICVRDEGCGIMPAHLEKIFEPFFTTKRTGEGTGLGLSTVYGIVKQTGGYIFCDSKVGVGTSFSLYFPAQVAQGEAAAKAQPASAGCDAPAQPAGNATVLLVEDEAPVRAFASRALSLKGYEVLEADSAEQALDLLQDRSLHVDLFVTDVVMPGMDGPGWVRQALKDRPGTGVVFMSGYTEDIFGEDHIPIPNSEFLTKPFTLTELTDMVHRHLTKPRSRVTRH